MKIRTTVKCPYCGSINKVQYDHNYPRNTEVVYCDVEGGGCDKRFLVDYEVVLNTNSVKIEGEE